MNTQKFAAGRQAACRVDSTWMPISPDEARRSLELLGHDDAGNLLMWNFPEGYEWPDGDLDELVQEYMQFAGDSSRMTIEVRRLEETGYRQYVLGKPPDGGESTDEPLDEMITYANDQFELWVRSNELFDAAEATMIAEEYLETNEVSDHYAMRLLDLDKTERPGAP